RRAVMPFVRGCYQRGVVFPPCRPVQPHVSPISSPGPYLGVSFEAVGFFCQVLSQRQVELGCCFLGVGTHPRPGLDEFLVPQVEGGAFVLDSVGHLNSLLMVVRYLATTPAAAPPSASSKASST